jgi:hypothetical protein
MFVKFPFINLLNNLIDIGLVSLLLILAIVYLFNKLFSEKKKSKDCESCK